MKAVILAGGEGTRLRPLSCGTPKPMTPLLDRPLLAHTLELLRENGVTDVAVTLCYMPQVFESYFGDGSRFGVRLTWYREETPLGTAGGAAACREFLDDELLILSGDAVCDFRFAPLADFHREHRAEATVVLTRQSDPLGYGLVLTAPDGRVERFIEKPSWDRVFTDAVNTGIYLLAPGVLKSVPAGRKYDFAHDLFPRMLRQGRGLFAAHAEGYWRDVGSADAYLACVRDALTGRVRLRLPQADRGIRALSPVPADAVISAPVYIGENVTIGEGAHIGPYTALGAGSKIGQGARVTGSAVNGASIGRGAAVRDSIVCRGARIGDGAALMSGCVIGENAVIGRDARLHAGVLVWPERHVAEGTEQRFNLTGRAPAPLPAVDAVLKGSPDGALTPETLLSLGLAAAAVSGAAARIGVGCENLPACGTAASAIECGVRAGGARAVRCGGSFAAAAAFAARYASFDLTFFVRADEEGGLCVHLFDADGLPTREERLRQLAFTLRQGDFRRADAAGTGRVMKLSGLMDAYCRAAAAGSAEGRIYAVRAGTAAPALCNSLWLMGARIAPYREGRAAFALSRDGLALTVTDERGYLLSDAHTMACAAFAALDLGEELALPADAPAALEELAARFGKRALREDADGEEARRILAEQRFLTDGVFRAAYLAAYAARRGTTIAALAEKVPRFYVESRELPLTSDRARFMREAAGAFRTDPPYGRGIRIRMDGGTVTVAPRSTSCAVRILAETGSAETARELCDGIAARLEQLDHDIKRRKNGQINSQM